MKILLLRHPTLTKNQLDRFSNIFDNAGQVIFGVVVLSPLISSFDKLNLLVILLGLTAICFCWVISIWFAKKGENI